MLWSKKRLSVAGLACLAAGAARVAEAGSVKGVSKKRGVVAVELEEDEQVEKGSTMCLFNEDGKKIGCGAVAAVKGTLASVKLDDDAALAKVKKGMAAKIGEGDDKKAADADEGGKKKRKKKKKKKRGESDGEGEAGLDAEKSEASAKTYKGKKSPFRVWLGYGPAIATPAAYNRVTYNFDNAHNPPLSVWSADRKIAQTLVGFDLQVGVPLGAFSLNPGLRYRKFTPSLVDADYKPNFENPYVSTEQQATALGLYADFEYFKAQVGAKGLFNLTTGLDVDQSTVTLNATLKDDNGSTTPRTVASATSKLTVISLRVGADLEYQIQKPFGLFGGLQALVPLTEVGKSFSGSMTDNDANANAKPADPSSDLKTALGHKKNTFGLEVVMGAVLAF